MAAAAGACNSISGVNDLDFVEAGSVQAGSGAASSGGSTSSAGATGTGASGAGGSSCGPCDDPGSDCKESIGECVGGVCTYADLGAGVACDDGNACTEGDACDGRGACVPGPECPEEPCEVRTCEMTGCTTAAAAEGASCDAGIASMRCCGGACADTSTDPNNCGGCGQVCGSGECQSVEDTPDCPQGCEPAPTCEVAPAQTTGRCTCIGGGECPDGQLCRDETPYDLVCAPSSDANCAPDQVKIEVLGCPNYCLY